MFDFTIFWNKDNQHTYSVGVEGITLRRFYTYSAAFDYVLDMVNLMNPSEDDYDDDVPTLSHSSGEGVDVATCGVLAPTVEELDELPDWSGGY